VKMRTIFIILCSISSLSILANKEFKYSGQKQKCIIQKSVSLKCKFNSAETEVAFSYEGEVEGQINENGLCLSQNRSLPVGSIHNTRNPRIDMHIQTNSNSQMYSNKFKINGENGNLCSNGELTFNRIRQEFYCDGKDYVTFQYSIGQRIDLQHFFKTPVVFAIDKHGTFSEVNDIAICSIE
jgi:hypothetical protein